MKGFEPVTQHPRPRLFRLRYALVAAGGLIFVALVSIPSLDGPNSRQYRNEAVAVSKLRTIVDRQRKFAAAHVDKGFACELPLLVSQESGQSPGDYDPLRFLITGTHAGYKFLLNNCRTDANGLVVHYEAIAVPVELRKTGFHAFCTDDSGLLWYDAKGVATSCIASRRVLNE